MGCIRREKNNKCAALAPAGHIVRLCPTPRSAHALAHSLLRCRVQGSGRGGGSLGCLLLLLKAPAVGGIQCLSPVLVAQLNAGWRGTQHGELLTSSRHSTASPARQRQEESMKRGDCRTQGPAIAL
jgi:hypothetical protein